MAVVDVVGIYVWSDCHYRDSFVVSIVWKGNEDVYKDEKQDNSREGVVKEGGTLVKKL